MARKFVSIKPVDMTGEKPDRPSDEVLWENLENCWFDKGVLRQRPALVDPALYTAIAGTGTANPLQLIVQYYHPVAVETEQTRYPDGAGSNSDWTAVPAASPPTSYNYQRVDEKGYVDTDYVYATTSGSGHKDSYDFESTSTFFCKENGDEKDIVGEDDAGNATLTIPAAPGSVHLWEDFTYTAKYDPHQAAGTLWTAARFNSYEFGYYATFSSAACTETLQPTSDGNDADWTLNGGATYKGILSGNADLSPADWTSYIYTDENSYSFSVNFAAGTNAFDTITSVEPKIWVSNYGGSRELKLFVDDNNGNDSEYLVSAFEPGPLLEEYEDYDEYVDEVPNPEQIDWTLVASNSYTTDPANGDNAWSASTIHDYDWNVKTTESEQGLWLEIHRGPSAFTTATDWVMWHDSETKSGSVGCVAGMDGTPHANVFYDFDTGIYTGNVAGRVTGTFIGTLKGDNIEITDNTGDSVGVWCEGTITGTGTISAIKADCEFDGSLYCEKYSTGHGSTTVEDQSATGVPKRLYELIVDQTLWSTDWISDDPWKTAFAEQNKYVLMRDYAFQGDYDVEIAMTDLPSLSYKAIHDSGVGLVLTARRYDSSPLVKGGMNTVAPDWLVFSTAAHHYAYNGLREKWLGGPPGATAAASETAINADYFYLTGDLPVSTASETMRIYSLNYATRFVTYPETRVYKFELEVIGTAGPQPTISQFNITLEGSTSTDKRSSKLLVSSSNFYRRDTSTTLTDVEDAGATSATVKGVSRWDTTKFFGKQYFTNGIDAMWRYPNASNKVEDLGGAAPKAFTISAYISRLFCGHTTESGTVFPDRVRWSAIEDDQDFTSGDSGYIDLDDTDGHVVKLLPLGGIMVAYKDTSLYNLHGTGSTDNPIVKQLISPGIGCAAMGTALSVVGKDGLPSHIFLGQGRGGYNVYMYTGNLLTPIGDDIKEELRDNINPRQSQNAFAIVDQKRNQYMFFIAYKGETFPRRAWLYDIDTGDWKHWKFPEVTCAGQLEANEESTVIDTWTMFLGKPDSLSYWMDPDVYQDVGSVNVAMKAESGDWAVERRENYATLYRLHIYYEDWGRTKVKVSTSVDGGLTYSAGEIVTFGGDSSSDDGQIQIAKVDAMATGKRFRIKIEADYNFKIAITEIQMELEEQGWIV
jgi:hypothetical protein